jgi:hypothetical protein
VAPLENVRLQRIVRAAVERMLALPIGDDVDETFYEALRWSLVAAGATDAEIEGIAHLFMKWTVERPELNSERRVSQLDLIADHLARPTRC